MSNDLSSLVNNINQSKLNVYSVDIPSGINGDTSAVLGEAFKASKTITFLIKKCHYLYLEKYCGEIIVEDIGIKKNVFDKIVPNIKKMIHHYGLKIFISVSSDHKYSEECL